MKVLLTHHYFPPDFAGGGEVVALQTAKGLMRSGVDVSVLTTGDPAITEYEGIPTLRLPMHRYRLNFASGEVIERARGVDVIQAFNYHACLPSLAAGRRLGKPVVCCVLGLYGNVWNQMRNPIVGPIWSSAEKFILTRDFSRWVFLSDFSRAAGIAMGVPEDRTVVNCPGIDLGAYGPASVKEKVVFFSGRLDRRRGIDSLLAVARRLPHVRFRVMGWGPEEEVRASAPANVEVVKFERGEPLRRAFGAASIFFLPSRAETFGIAVVEAMASGCAIVSSVPLEFDGIHVGAEDQDAMASAVETLWNNPDEAARMGSRNQERAKRYQWSSFTENMLATYQAVLDGR